MDSYIKTSSKTKSLIIIIVVLLVIFTGCTKEPDLISRQILFGNPDKASLKISPDHQWLSYLAPSNNVMNVWVAPIENPDEATVVTQDTIRGIRRYFWSYTDNRIIYLQDEGGDENWQVHVADVITKEDKNLTPFEEILDDNGEPIFLPSGKKLKPRAEIQEVSYKFPNEILIRLNNRNAQFHDVFRLNIHNGEMTMIQQNDRFSDFITDDDYLIRYAMQMNAKGGNDIYVPDVKNNWVLFDEIPMEDMLTTWPVDFDKSGNLLYMIDSRGRNTAALVSVNLENGTENVLYENDKADLSDIMMHPIEKTIEAAASNYLRTGWEIFDDSIKEAMDELKTISDGEIYVTSRSLDDNFWTIAFEQDDGPYEYYLYDRLNGKISFLFTNRPKLEKVKLSKMHPMIIKSRDDFNLVSYLTLPYWTDKDNDGYPKEALPMVLFVHGGPWGRDVWGYHSYHQWLANRGYAVLSVNFRASTGFGKDFINASNMEWAGKMHDDLIDAVNWAVDNKIADKEKIAIMGGSYGGYATLVGLTFTPDVFACGVDIVGPSNLRTLLETIPPYWVPMIEMFTTRVGDHRTEEGREFLDSRSPLTFVDKISKPLLIGQGANDPRVKQSESDQIVKAMEEKNIPVVYVLYPDEGHGFARPENRLSFNAVTDLFLSEHLGGRFEDIGDDFEGSSITIPKGKENIPTLSEQ